MKYITSIPLFSIALLLSFAIGPHSDSFAQTPAQKTYVKIGVDGLSCPFCAYGLEKKLSNIQSAEDLHIALKEGEATFSVADDHIPSEEDLRKVIKDAGFTAREIQFSKVPYERDQNE